MVLYIHICICTVLLHTVAAFYCELDTDWCGWTAAGKVWRYEPGTIGATNQDDARSYAYTKSTTQVTSPLYSKSTVSCFRLSFTRSNGAGLVVSVNGISKFNSDRRTVNYWLDEYLPLSIGTNTISLSFTGSVKVGFIEISDGECQSMLGDIKLVTANSSSSTDGRQGAAASSAALRWLAGVIPYRIDDTIGATLEADIQAVMREIEIYTCIRFSPHASANIYLKISASANSCFSTVGSVLGAETNLGSSCNFLRNVRHELMHAIGFHHEQNRPDRDEWINIDWTNIQELFWSQWKMRTSGIDYYGEAYDYISVMHYTTSVFAKDRTKPTMTRKKDGPEIASTTVFSASDFRQINAMYRCDAAETVAKYDEACFRSRGQFICSKAVPCEWGRYKCRPGFEYLEALDECVPVRAQGETCSGTTTDMCAINQHLQCTDKVCKCEPGYRDGNFKDCIAQNLQVTGASCSTRFDCTYNLVCTNSKCACASDHKVTSASDQYCDMKQVGDTCSMTNSNADCWTIIPGAWCIDGKCACTPAFTQVVFTDNSNRQRQGCLVKTKTLGKIGDLCSDSNGQYCADNKPCKACDAPNMFRSVCQEPTGFHWTHEVPENIPLAAFAWQLRPSTFLVLLLMSF